VEELKFLDDVMSWMISRHGANITKDIFKVFGIDELSPVKKTDDLLKEDDVSGVSGDPNANIGNDKYLPMFRYIPYKPLSKVVNLKFLYDKFVELYGKEVAQDLILDLIDGTVYIHDLSSSVLIPYCSVLSTKDIYQFGRPWAEPKGFPPKRAQSFINQVIETLLQLSQEQAGALALSDLIPVYCIALVKEKIINFNGDVRRAIKNCFSLPSKLKKTIENDFQSFIHIVHNRYRSGFEAPFTNISIYDTPILERLFDEQGLWIFLEKLGCYMEDEFKVDFINFIKKCQLIFVSFMAKGDPSNKGLPYRFPVCTLNLSVDEDGNFIDEKYANKLLSYNTKGYFNIFNAFNTAKVASCCRLINDYELIRGIDSFGNGGSAFNIGSFRVVSLNLPRWAFELKQKHGFFPDDDKIYDSLKVLLNKARKVLKAQRSIIKPFLKYHLAFKQGWYHEKNFFSTFGFIGMAEAVAQLGWDYSVDPEVFSKVVEKILHMIHEIVNSFIKEDKIPYNIEQVPGESLAETFARLDWVVYGLKFSDDSVDIYSNQFIPLWWDVDFIEKAKIEAKYYSALSGGGITHLNMDCELTQKQVQQFAKFAAKIGLEHYALNPILARCSNGHVVFGRVDKCPICQAKIDDFYTRIVGYFTEVRHWLKSRKDEFWNRKTHIQS